MTIAPYPQNDEPTPHEALLPCICALLTWNPIDNCNTINFTSVPADYVFLRRIFSTIFSSIHIKQHAHIHQFSFGYSVLILRFVIDWEKKKTTAWTRETKLRKTYHNLLRCMYYLVFEYDGNICLDFLLVTVPLAFAFRIALWLVSMHSSAWFWASDNVNIAPKMLQPQTIPSNRPFHLNFNIRLSVFFVFGRLVDGFESQIIEITHRRCGTKIRDSIKLPLNRGIRKLPPILVPAKWENKWMLGLWKMMKRSFDFRFVYSWQSVIGL